MITVSDDPAADTTRTVRSAARRLHSGVSVGPFEEMPPLGLWRRIAPLPDGRFRTGEQVRAGAAEWLRTALTEAGVELGAYDQTVVDLLARDCTTTVQVVAGWIARARSPDVDDQSRSS